ncbi:MAG: AzlC family ABC transporter permease [Lachnospiraceae bacterium]|nr:AzlC family ABC transporter permease [Lachnospiraceae bacterium]
MLHNSNVLNTADDNRKAFFKGLQDGVPIAMGYFAVAFSLGFMAKKCTLIPLQGFIGSFFTRASAGEYGVYTMVVQDASYLAVIVMSLITNLRYLLMSTSLSQKFSPKTPLFQRILVGCCVTDEIFGISIAYPGDLNPWYTWGAAAISTPLWALGTMSGIIAGSVLPARAVSALSVALYGMFLAIIIPPSRKDRAVLIAVAVSFLASFSVRALVNALSLSLSDGIVTIVLTIVIAAAAALIKPVADEPEEAS